MIGTTPNDEIDRLPKSFRLPVMLCYFDGLTLDDAARKLHWPAGTVRSRLARARDKLRRGLTRRGIVLPAAAMAAALTPRSASASVSSSLCDATTKAAVRFASGEAVSASATVLAREVLRSMMLHTLKFTLLTLLVLGAVATGAGFLSHALARKDEPKGPSSGPQPPIGANQPDTTQRPALGRMFVVGRVLDPQGKPVPNADVMVYARLKQSDHPVLYELSAPSTSDRARCDGSGRFRLDAVRTSSSRHDALGVTAMAPGYGIGWIEIDPDADQPATEIMLRSEQVIRGRLFDIQGRPAQGVKVTVA